MEHEKMEYGTLSANQNTGQIISFIFSDAKIRLKQARKGSKKELKRARRNLKDVKMRIRKLQKSNETEKFKIKFKEEHKSRRKSSPLGEMIQNALEFKPSEIKGEIVR